MTAASASSGPSVPDDLLPALHEEIARLPEKYRLPVVLCDLEGLPQAEAAGQLRWSERTLRRRLAEARDRLKARLTRRGLAPDGAALGAVFLREARAAVPPAWNAAAVRAALHTIDPSLAAGTVSAAARSLTQEVLRTMLVRKLTIASAALLGRRDAGVGGLGRPDLAAAMSPRKRTRRRSRDDRRAPAPRHRRATRSSGRHLPGPRPRARPRRQAGRRRRDLRPTSTRSSAGPRSIRTPEGQKGRVTVSDADGRFRFDLDKASSDWPYGDEPAWHGAHDRGRRAGAGHGLGRRRIAAQGG